MMDINEIADNTSSNKIISALVTIILAGFLWVGKTTFEHVGQVAGLRHEIESLSQDRLPDDFFREHNDSSANNQE